MHQTYLKYHKLVRASLKVYYNLPSNEYMIVCNTNAVTRTFAHKGSTPYLPYTYITALMLGLKKLTLSVF